MHPLFVTLRSSLHLMPSLDLLIAANADGTLRLTPAPHASSAGMHAQLHAAAALGSSVPLWRIQHAKMRAHKGKITSAVLHGSVLATGSNAGETSLCCCACPGKPYPLMCVLPNTSAYGPQRGKQVQNLGMFTYIDRSPTRRMTPFIITHTRVTSSV